MKTRIYIVIIAVLVALITNMGGTQAEVHKQYDMSEQVLRNTLMAFGELDGGKLTADQVNHLMGLDCRPLVDERRATIADGEWL